MLLEGGADVSTFGEEALKAASQYGHVEVAELLLDRGVDVGMNGEEILMGLLSWERMEVVELLLERSVNINMHAGRIWWRHQERVILKLLSY